MNSRLTIVIVVLSALVVFVTLLKQQGGYDQLRPQLTDLAGVLMRLRNDYAQYYASYGRFPVRNQDLDYPAADKMQAGMLQMLAVLPDHRVYLHLQLAATETATVFLTPEVNSADQFLWHCRTPDLPKALRSGLFSTCNLTREQMSPQQALVAARGKGEASATARTSAHPPAVSTAPNASSNTSSNTASTPAPAPTPCNSFASPNRLLVHDKGVGVWDFSATPRLIHFIPLDITRAEGFLAQIGNTLYVARDNAIQSADLTAAAPQLEPTPIWIKPGTRLYSAGTQLIWITQERNLFVGDVCQPPQIRIVHTLNLDDYTSGNIVRMDVHGDQLYMLSSSDPDYQYQSSALDIYRIKPGGSLLHGFHFDIEGSATGMYLAEPLLLVAKGREGLDIYERTLDQRWLKAQTVSTLDFAMDALLLGDQLWVADRSSGLVRFRRDAAGAPWQRLGQQVFDFPLFRLQGLRDGVLVSSATRHAWVPFASATPVPLEVGPTPPP